MDSVNLLKEYLSYVLCVYIVTNEWAPSWRCAEPVPGRIPTVSITYLAIPMAPSSQGMKIQTVELMSLASATLNFIICRFKLIRLC